MGIDLHRQIPYKKTLENDKYRLKLLVIGCKDTTICCKFQNFSTNSVLKILNSGFGSRLFNLMYLNKHKMRL